MDYFDILKGQPYPLGVTVQNDGVLFTVNVGNSKECGLILNDIDSGSIMRIPFSKEYRFGNIASIKIRNLNYEKHRYNFYFDDRIVVDPYSKWIAGNEIFGIKDSDSYSLSSNIVRDDYNWENDSFPKTEFDQTIMYLLHVRGFTKAANSKVKAKGTFEGIREKIPYLKQLGITALELMPAYEFEEFSAINPDVSKQLKDKYIDADNRINYWGYQNAFYFAPKASYSYSNNPVNEFKGLIKELHANNIEIIMQFYFPDSYKADFIQACIKYWCYNYHIDGVHLKGNNMPLGLLANDPLLSDTKIMYDYIDSSIAAELLKDKTYKNLCCYSDEFMYTIRRFLKGDEDMLKRSTQLFNKHDSLVYTTNFITNYYGFTLNDLVSYDRKHNENNGENNLDGTDYNFSWNCGVEGVSRKPAVMLLRKKMMKNALCTMMLSQGVPVVLSGDELCNTKAGNNNSYCQDNEINYINWNTNKQNEEIFDFYLKLLDIRKNIFCDYIGYNYSYLDREKIGFPDLSYHGSEVYREDMATYNRHIAIMYARKKNDNISKLTYVAYNMYWDSKNFALPNLFAGNTWKCILSTGNVEKLDNNKGSNIYNVEGRSVAVFYAEVSNKKLKGNPGNLIKDISVMDITDENAEIKIF